MSQRLSESDSALQEHVLSNISKCLSALQTRKWIEPESASLLVHNLQAHGLELPPSDVSNTTRSNSSRGTTSEPAVTAPPSLPKRGGLIKEPSELIKDKDHENNGPPPRVFPLPQRNTPAPPPRSRDSTAGPVETSGQAGDMNVSVAVEPQAVAQFGKKAVQSGAVSELVQGLKFQAKEDGTVDVKVNPKNGLQAGKSLVQSGAVSELASKMEVSVSANSSQQQQIEEHQPPPPKSLAAMFEAQAKSNAAAAVPAPLPRRNVPTATNTSSTSAPIETSSEVESKPVPSRVGGVKVLPGVIPLPGNTAAAAPPAVSSSAPVKPPPGAVPLPGQIKAPSIPVPASSVPPPVAPPPRTKPAKKKTFVAINDFSAETQDDLGFKKGDIITLIQIVDDNWYEGELNGQRGIFPKTFVQEQS